MDVASASAAAKGEPGDSADALMAKLRDARNSLRAVGHEASAARDGRGARHVVAPPPRAVTGVSAAVGQGARDEASGLGEYGDGHLRGAGGGADALIEKLRDARNSLRAVGGAADSQAHAESALGSMSGIRAVGGSAGGAGWPGGADGASCAASLLELPHHGLSEGGSGLDSTYEYLADAGRHTATSHANVEEEEEEDEDDDDDDDDDEWSTPIPEGARPTAQTSTPHNYAKTSRHSAAGAAAARGLAEAASGGQRLDLTGDGQRETVGYDTNGDGRVDALDTNGDGRIDARIVHSAAGGRGAPQQHRRVPSGRHPGGHDVDDDDDDDDDGIEFVEVGEQIDVTFELPGPSTPPPPSPDSSR